MPAMATHHLVVREIRNRNQIPVVPMTQYLGRVAPYVRMRISAKDGNVYILMVGSIDSEVKTIKLIRGSTTDSEHGVLQAAVDVGQVLRYAEDVSTDPSYLYRITNIDISYLPKSGPPIPERATLSVERLPDPVRPPLELLPLILSPKALPPIVKKGKCVLASRTSRVNRQVVCEVTLISRRLDKKRAIFTNVYHNGDQLPTISKEDRAPDYSLPRLSYTALVQVEEENGGALLTYRVGKSMVYGIHPTDTKPRILTMYMLELVGDAPEANERGGEEESSKKARMGEVVM